MINIRRKYSVPGVMIIIRPAFGAGCVQQSGNAVESQGSINVIDVSVYFSQFGNAGDIPLSCSAPVRRTTCGNVGFRKPLSLMFIYGDEELQVGLNNGVFIFPSVAQLFSSSGLQEVMFDVSLYVPSLSDMQTG